jgi:hypothetical protein
MADKLKGKFYKRIRKWVKFDGNECDTRCIHYRDGYFCNLFVKELEMILNNDISANIIRCKSCKRYFIK